MKPQSMSCCPLLVALSFMLLGCATTPNADLAGFGAYDFPSVTLVFTSESMQYRETRARFISALSESGAFASIDIENPYSQYALEINIEFDNKLDSMGDAVVTGAALGAIVVPVQMDYLVTGHVRVRKDNEVIDSFPVNFEHRRVQTLLHAFSKDGGWGGALRVAAQRIIENLQDRDSFKMNVPHN